ncbi:MAG: hypothetical protein RRZ69_01510 [Clostridia bacterium]
MKKCYICGKQIDGGMVVDKECVDKLIAENKRLQALGNDSELLKCQDSFRSEQDYVSSKQLRGFELIKIGEIVTVIEDSRSNYIEAKIIDGVLKASYKIGVIVDEEKIKKWIRMCIGIEQVPEAWRQRWGCAVKISELEREIESLSDKIEKMEDICNE